MKFNYYSIGEDQSKLISLESHLNDNIYVIRLLNIFHTNLFHLEVYVRITFCTHVHPSAILGFSFYTCTVMALSSIFQDRT